MEQILTRQFDLKDLLVEGREVLASDVLHDLNGTPFRENVKYSLKKKKEVAF